MDQFNTRELASITWGAILIMALIFYSVKNAQLRYSLITVIKAFFQIKIITDPSQNNGQHVPLKIT